MQRWDIELLIFEKVYLTDLLEECKNNMTMAAKMAGIQRHQLRRMIIRNKISLPKFYNTGKGLARRKCN